MNERRSHAEERGDPAGTTFTEAARRNTHGTKLETAIEASIDSEAPECRWVDIEFELRGTSDLRYQIHRIDHNRVYSIDIADVDRIELSPTTSSDRTDETGATNETEPSRSGEEQRILDWVAESRGEEFADEYAELILAQARLVGEL